jgi:lipopolysaccharide cholinephosphotransferase
MLSALQASELGILQACLRICAEHRIRYFLIGGSALGTVRHGGFIPWDDDIDIGMPRPDYDRFVSVAQAALPDGLFLQNDKTDPCFPLQFSKIQEATTSATAGASVQVSVGHRGWVDVFPLDGFPDSLLGQRVSAAVFGICNLAIQRRLGHGKPSPDDGPLMRLVKEAAIRICVAAFPLESLRRTADSVVRCHGYAECDVVINWGGAWRPKEKVPRKFFGEGRIAEFEGIAVTIPSDHDGYLRAVYGDYMTLPPLEERISPHEGDR